MLYEHIHMEEKLFPEILNFYPFQVDALCKSTAEKRLGTALLISIFNGSASVT